MLNFVVDWSWLTMIKHVVEHLLDLLDVVLRIGRSLGNHFMSPNSFDE